MVDPERLADLLARLGNELAELARLGAFPDEELDADRMAAAKYRLVVACEIAIDVANHVIASEGLRRPQDFADSFAALAESGIVASDLGERLAAMARFRNLLVHGYARVDDVRVREIIRRDLGDLRAFREAAARLGT